MQQKFFSKVEILAALGEGGEARMRQVEERLKRRAAKKKAAKCCEVPLLMLAVAFLPLVVLVLLALVFYVRILK